MNLKTAILCVDDEAVILQSMRSQLKEHYGNTYLYEFAESPAEGMEILESFASEGIDSVIIVSDWLMPEMRGDQFLINVQKSFPHTIKILLTGQADANAVARARKDANLHRFLPKPWENEDLFEAIDSGVERLKKV
jgi:CheY-like chemotaxis protein